MFDPEDNVRRIRPACRRSEWIALQKGCDRRRAILNNEDGPDDTDCTDVPEYHRRGFFEEYPDVLDELFN